MGTYVVAVLLAASNTFQLPPGLLSAVCYVESHHIPKAINRTDRGEPSLGVCQVKYSTAKWLGYQGTPLELQTDAALNAYIAAAYLKYQLRRYHGDAFKAVAAYNAGHYMEDLDGMPVNKRYVVKVLRAWRERR